MKIALIAHDKKKNDIIKLAIDYVDVLKEHTLYATGTTGALVMGETGLKVIRMKSGTTGLMVMGATNLKITQMKSGPLGGDQQIGSMIAESQLDLVIFLRDPLTSQPHEPDVNALLRLCDVTSTPLATNIASAKVMLEAVKNGYFK